MATIGWQHLARLSGDNSVASIGWQQLRGNNCVATFSAARWQLCGGNIWCGSVATSRWQRFGRVLLVAASSSRRRRSVVGSSSLWLRRRLVVLYTAILTHRLGSGVRGGNEAWALQRGWGTWGLQRLSGHVGAAAGARLLSSPRLVVAASSCPASARLASDISVATFRWQHFDGTIRARSLSPRVRRRVVVAASPSLRLVVAAPRRRRLYRYPHPSSWVT